MRQRVTSLRSACSIAIAGELSRAFVYSPGPAKPSKNVIPMSRNWLAMMGNHADMYRRSSVCFAAVWGSRAQRVSVGTANGSGRRLFRELVPHFALEFSATGLGGSASPLLEEEGDAR